MADIGRDKLIADLTRALALTSAILQAAHETLGALSAAKIVDPADGMARIFSTSFVLDTADEVLGRAKKMQANLAREEQDDYHSEETEQEMGIAARDPDADDRFQAFDPDDVNLR